MKDLRSFLEERKEKYPREVCRIQREVSVKHILAFKGDLFPTTTCNTKMVDPS